MALATRGAPPSGANRERRVALVFCGFGGGGIERSTLRLTKALIERGFRVDLVVQEASGPLLARGAAARRASCNPKMRAWWRARIWTLAAEPAALGLVLGRKIGTPQPRSDAWSSCRASSNTLNAPVLTPSWPSKRPST